MLSGSVLQFTGFVKAASTNLPALSEVIPPGEVAPLALLVKAPRYLGLLIAIPLFASLIRRKAYVPWFLWAFLAAGLIGSAIYGLNQGLFKEVIKPIITPIYGIFWSIAMAGIGLNADIKALLSDDGAKAILMAFGGFIAAIIVFLAGISIVM